ncbi:MAG: hypothetical protein JJU33_09695 [Phycisphaerales bacterium]|nr:hypothetical protein [Phycisphaerales bacterium]
MKKFSTKRAVLACAAITMAAGSAFGDPAMDLLIERELHVDRYELVDLELPGAIGNGFTVGLDLGGELVQVEMLPFSVRSPSFRVLVDDGTEIREVDAPESRTLRGFGLTHPDVVSAASLSDTGLTGLFIVPGPGGEGGTTWVVQPLLDLTDEAPFGRHVLYRADDTFELPYKCGVDHENPEEFMPHRLAHQDAAQPESPEPQPETPMPRSGMLLADIAYDFDFQGYQWAGSSVSESVARTEAIQNAVTLIYERDTDITYDITEIIVRTSSASNPYTTNNAGNLLVQFRNHWNGNHNSVPRDVAHLLTGRNTGGTLGVAYLGVICQRNSAYGLSRLTWTNNFNLRISVVAHELGHNWNAPHCNGASPCNIMCSGINGCNGVGLPNFAPVSVNTITSFRNTRTCLTPTGPVAPTSLPITDTFPAGSLNPSVWGDFEGASIVFPLGATPPAGSTVMRLTLNQFAETVPLALESAGTDVVVEFAWSSFSMEAGKSLRVDVSDSSGNFTEIGAIVADGSFPSAYTYESFAIPANLLNDGGTVRFRAQVADTSDVWYVDDLYIGEPVTPACPPDLNGDGVVDADDFFLFLQLFAAGDPAADFNNDGVIDADDFFAFLGAFAAGC